MELQPPRCNLLNDFQFYPTLTWVDSGSECNKESQSVAQAG